MIMSEVMGEEDSNNFQQLPASDKFIGKMRA